MTLTAEQIDTSVSFVTSVLMRNRKVAEIESQRFKKALEKFVKEDGEIQAICSRFKPGPMIRKALKEAAIESGRFPPAVFDLVFDRAKGTIDVYEAGEWRTLT